MAVPWRLLTQVIEEVRVHGRVHINVEAAEQLLKADLRCHKCAKVIKNMPELKSHIQACKAQSS